MSESIGNNVEKPYIDDYFNTRYQATSYTQLSEEYSRHIKEMDKSISLEDLAEMNTQIRKYPEYRITTLIEEGMSPHDKQIKALRKYQRRIDVKTTPIGKILCDSEKNMQVTIYDPLHHPRTLLNEFLKTSGTCHILNDKLSDDQLKYHSVVGPLDADARQGGCIHYLLKARTGVAYNRLFLVVDMHNDVVLFHDAIESNAVERTNVAEYLRDGQESLLRGTLATDIILARRLNISKIAFGEPELIDLTQKIGAELHDIFEPYSMRNEEKLGLIAGTKNTHSGPFSYRLTDHKRVSLIRTDAFHK